MMSDEGREHLLAPLLPSQAWLVPSLALRNPHPPLSASQGQRLCGLQLGHLEHKWQAAQTAPNPRRTLGTGASSFSQMGLQLCWVCCIFSDMADKRDSFCECLLCAS